MKVAVIGAGVAGLACAYDLQKKGFEVIVYEADDRVGGRMSSRAKDGLIFDIGADHLTDNYEAMKAYAEELGLGWERMDFVNYRVYRDGKLHTTSQVVNWWTRIRLVQQWMRTPTQYDYFDFSQVAHLDTESAEDFFRRRCGSEAVDYLLDAYCAAYQFHLADETSKAALITTMCSHKKENEGWYLHHLAGGMKVLPEALAEQLEVRLQSPVDQVSQRHGKWHIVSGDQEETADALVFACPGDIIPKILSDCPPSLQEFFADVRYASTISVAFRVDASRLSDVSTVWVPFVEQGKVCSYVNGSYKGHEMMNDGETLVSVWLHHQYAQELLGLPDEEVYKAVKEAFLEVCPWFDDAQQLEAFDLQRWEKAEPMYYPGYLKKVNKFFEQYQGENQLWFCGDYLNSPWTEGALRSGKKVAQQIAEQCAV